MNTPKRVPTHSTREEVGGVGRKVGGVGAEEGERRRREERG